MPKVAQGKLQLTAGMRQEDIDRLDVFARSQGWDRGSAIVFFLDTADHMKELEQQARAFADQAHQDREEARRIKADAMADRSKLDQQEAKILGADAELRRILGISRTALELLHELIEAGATKADVLAWGEALREAKVDPAKAASLFREAGGLVEWSRRLTFAVTEASRSLGDLQQKVAASKQAIQMLQAQEAEKHAQVMELSNLLDDARQKVALYEAAAGELGVYVDLLRSIGDIRDLPATVNRVVAGIVLMAGINAHGDATVNIPGDVHLGRIPSRMRLSDIPYLLAPQEAYRELRDAQARQQVRAEIMAADGQAVVSDGMPDTTGAAN